MFLNLLDPVDLMSHLLFVKSCPTVTSCFYGQNKSKILLNLFHALLNNPNNKKNLRWYDRGQKLMGFIFKSSLRT